MADAGVAGRRGAARSLGLSAVLALTVAVVPAARAQPAAITPATVAPAIQAGLAMRPAAYAPALAKDWPRLQHFYEARGYRPAWLGNPAAAVAVSTLEASAADGLDPARYHDAALAGRAPLTTPAAAARYDMVLTDGLLRYARDIHRGQVVPSRVDKMVGVDRPDYDAAASLEAALDQGRVPAWIAALPPAHPEYARLKAALARYCAIAAKGGWPTVPQVRKIELEAGNPQLAALQARLAATDPALNADTPANLDALETAVKRFQARNGLEVDGVVGRKTIAALNISAARRVAQIKANMERWRWLPHRFPARYVAVNTADATLKAVDNGKTVLTSRVIVGKPKTESPLFSAKAVALTINPYWNVPTSIARNEILPKVRRDPAYLARHHMEMVDGRIRQKPGADNALGYLKVEMPNRFSSYLHDTSARRLFASDKRHRSHGCIRVQKIQPLASWLLTGDTEKGLERIKAAIDTGVTQQIGLDRQVPVYVLYWTVIAHQDGTAAFRPDVYGRDKTLIAALAGRPKPSSASMGATECAGWG